MRIQYGKRWAAQPCWSCTKALGGCSWADSGTPVDGWDAEPTELKDVAHQTLHSYEIKYCPEYELEPYNCNDCKNKGRVVCKRCCYNPQNYKNCQTLQPLWESNLFEGETE